jgi:hypothetical protein
MNHPVFSCHHQVQDISFVYIEQRFGETCRPCLHGVIKSFSRIQLAHDIGQWRTLSTRQQSLGSMKGEKSLD